MFQILTCCAVSTNNSARLSHGLEAFRGADIAVVHGGDIIPANKDPQVYVNIETTGPYRKKTITGIMDLYINIFATGQFTNYSFYCR